MSDKLTTVFGGTGFLGQQVVRALAAAGHRVRVAARHPQAMRFHGIEKQLEPIAVDIRDDEAVAAALEGVNAAVNAISLYVESGDLSFEAIHVAGAERIAKHCKRVNAESLVHISGIGTGEDSPSSLIRAKTRGERVVTENFEPTTIFRPSVMFGHNDSFVSEIEKATRAPVVPLFGAGRMQLQPAYVKDVALACERAISRTDARGEVFELGGATVLSYREAVEAVCDQLGRKRLLLPFPMPLWKGLTHAMTVLPKPPLTIDQLYLLAMDNTVGSGNRTFADLGIDPESVLDWLQSDYEPTK